MTTPTNHSSLLFRACCLALTVTAMTFAIRAGILNQLSQDFGLSNSQLGWVNSMAFLGFPVAMIIGGALYNRLGAKILLIVAFVCHILGLGLTITANGFWTLLISTFFIGFANGAVEASCNPLIATIHKDNKITMLNRFHVWFPGGIVIGAITSKLMTDFALGWQLQIAVMLVPTVIYGFIISQQQFPKLDKTIATSTLSNIKALSQPLFIFMMLCMSLTATTELGTQQWIDKILAASGASPMVIMAMITGLMAVGRYFAGPVIKRLNPVGVLLSSAVISAVGIYSMSVATGNLVYFAAILFAIGVTYLWPTMIGFIAQYTPNTGALGLSIIGGAGMFAVSLWNPVIGQWIDNARAQATKLTTNTAEAELLAGQSVLANLTLFPMALIVTFALLYFYINKHNSSKALATG
ncbi:sugar MFS transporter [Colwelliaceae bacterium MEBiC 14330]